MKKRASGRVNHGLEAPPGMLEAAQKAVYNTLATLFHEPGVTLKLCHTRASPDERFTI